MPQERISKIIANTGVASRRKAEELIARGLVRLNGKKVKEQGAKADKAKDVIMVNGTVVQSSHEIYVALNKPRGYIATRSDEQKRKTVFDLLPSRFKQLHTVGRLDKETSGLLIFTNDGDFTNKVTHPRYGVRKKYQVTLHGKVANTVLEQISEGFKHPEFKVSPCGIEKLTYKKKENKTRFVLDIGEGKKREIRKIFEFFGYDIARLHRIQIGQYAVYGIPMGRWCMMDDNEVADVLKK